MKTAVEYSLKATKNTEFEQTQIGGSKDAADYCRKFYFDDILIYESFFLIMLNRNNIVIGWAKISQGGVTGTVCDPRIIAKYAIESLCSCVIMCHNHPSGSLKPSQPDLDITKKIKDGLKLFDIAVVDHIILTEEEYYSFADKGII